MFKIGDTVIHPRLGVCQVKEIKTQIVLEEEHNCFVLVPLFENHNNLKITIPVENGSKIGLRKPINPTQIEQVTTILSQTTSEINGQKISLPILKGKLASGDPLKIAEIIRDLSAKIKQDGGKYASARRRSFLKTAETRLTREISLTMGVSIQETTLEIHSLLGISL